MRIGINKPPDYMDLCGQMPVKIRHLALSGYKPFIRIQGKGLHCANCNLLSDRLPLPEQPAGHLPGQFDIGTSLLRLR